MDPEIDNNNEGQPNNNETKAVRPTLLTILCVFSLINGIYNGFSNLMLGISLPYVTEFFNNEDIMGAFPEMFRDAVDLTLNINRSYYFLTGLLYIASFIGVLYMWKLKKVGFHIYTLAQGFILIVASIFFYPHQEVSGFTSDLILTLLFVYMYYLNYKRIMK